MSIILLGYNIIDMYLQPFYAFERKKQRSMRTIVDAIPQIDGESSSQIEKLKIKTITQLEKKDFL